MLQQDVIEICEKTWCISEFKLVNAFVVEGTDKAAVIDTGCGLGNIRAIVDSLVSKPLSVLLTHSHPDHTGGIYEFKDCPIYMNKDDENTKIFGMERDNAFRRMYVETRGPVRYPGHVDDMLALVPEEEPDCSFSYTDIEDGAVFDLGKRRFLSIHTPGHTEGSICFLDENNRILFSGDTVNKSIILPRLENNANTLIERYHATLSKIWKMEKAFDRLAIGHDGILISKSIVHDYLVLTEKILSGEIKGSYKESGFRKGDVASLGDAELWFRCDQ